MAAGHELIVEFAVDFMIPPILTGVWLLFVSANNRIVSRRGTGSRIQANPWQVLGQMYLVMFCLTLIHACMR